VILLFTVGGLLLIFGVLIAAGYAVMNDYPLWQVAAGMLGVALVMAIAGLSLYRG
jgi:hypothetical protein